MQLDVQWFIAALVSEELMTKEACLQVLEKTGFDADLSMIAQEALDAASTGVDEGRAYELLELFQQVIEYAAQQGETGERPPPHLLPERAAPKVRIAGAPPLIKSSTPISMMSSGSGIPKMAAPVTGLNPMSSAVNINPIAAPGIKTAGLKTSPPGSIKILGQKSPLSHPAAGGEPTLAEIRMAVGINPVPEPPSLTSTGTMSGTSQWVKSETGETATGMAQVPPTSVPAGFPPPPTVNKFKVVDDKWHGIADFNHINGMNEEQAKDFVLMLLREVRKHGASDLHLSALSNPFVRCSSLIQPICDHILTPDEAMILNRALLNQSQKEYFDENKDINYALQIDASNRFRVCLMVHKDGAAGAYRLVPEKLLSLSELGFIPENVATIERFLDYHNGLVLVTGPIGSGKTTTLASMVNIINQKRHDHVITVEDPIEIVQYSKNCNVTQREVHVHTNSYKAALKGALREDPDVIIIGELHDLETIEMAITASETGHLVIGTLHTCDSANTLNRLLDVFPPTQQPQIRAMTAGSLRGIVCQRLLPTIDGSMTVSAEILVNTMAVANIISDGRTHHLRAVLQTGQSAGMVTMDVSVFNLYKRGLITRDVAMYNIRGRDVREDFKKYVAVEEAKKFSKKK